VRVVNKSGTPVEGVVYCVDAPSKCLVLETGSGEPNNFVILCISNLKSVEVLRSDLPPERDLRPLQVTTIEHLRQRERKAVEERKKESAKIGTGVSAHAQILFDSLSKTVPCEWDKTSIVVMQSIRIDSPYGLDNVVNMKPNGDEIAFDRVKLMLKHEAARLDKNSSISSS